MLLITLFNDFSTTTSLGQRYSFARDKIFEKLNQSSNEKLIDEQGEYTEYGEYVINLIAPSIAKYAFLKSLTGDKLKTKILPNGEITYDYRDIKEHTSLKTLGINGANPLDEAEQLLNLFEITEAQNEQNIYTLQDENAFLIIENLNYKPEDIEERLEYRESMNEECITRYNVYLDDTTLAQDVFSLEDAKRIAKEENGNIITKYTWKNEEDYQDYKEADYVEDIYLNEAKKPKEKKENKRVIMQQGNVTCFKENDSTYYVFENDNDNEVEHNNEESAMQDFLERVGVEPNQELQEAGK